jgi:site-specific DNA-methyltransferase (adenine-specific)
MIGYTDCPKCGLYGIEIIGDKEMGCEFCNHESIFIEKDYTLINDDCLNVMRSIPDKSVDMILCDLPYGTTPASWDSRIDMKKLWEEYERVIKDEGAIVLNSQQPFTSLLICSNLKLYKYNWVWEKDNGTNFLNSKFQPLKITEDICVFGKGATSFVKKGFNMNYNPQFTEGKAYTCKSGKQSNNSAVVRGGKGGREDVSGHITINDGKRYPKNLIKFNRDKDKLHPTQKPVALCEYLIETYTNKGDLVLDNTMGSGTTGIACLNKDRKFFGIEKGKEEFFIAKERIESHYLELNKEDPRINEFDKQIREEEWEKNQK